MTTLVARPARSVKASEQRHLLLATQHLRLMMLMLLFAAAVTVVVGRLAWLAIEGVAPAIEVIDSRYKNFKFRLKFEDGADYIAGLSKMTPLKRTTEVITHRDGGMISTVVNSPGQSKSEPITLERGITLSHTFEEWANQVFSPLGDGGNSLAGMRRNIIIELLNLQGNPVIKWKVYGCWVSEFNALPELDANAFAFAFESIVMLNHPFERDTDFAEEDAGIFNAG